jgi:hypothetical protein
MSTKLLTTSSQFNDAKLRQLHVTVYQHDELLDVGGFIEKHAQDTVKINGSYFWKRTCQFVIGE